MIIGFKNLIGEFSFTDRFKLSKKKPELMIDDSNFSKYTPVLHYFKNKQFFDSFFSENLRITLEDLNKSVDDDYLIREDLKELEALFKARNSLKDEKLLAHVSVNIAEKERSLELRMRKYCPNLLAVSGVVVGARLLRYAGSLHKLSLMAARKIQILGAESAFFMFLASKNKSAPKYGIIFNHELVKRAANKGRAARLLSDKIAIAAKIDFFKGEFIGDRLRKELEQKID
jgi:hypothetical protein